MTTKICIARCTHSEEQITSTHVLKGIGSIEEGVEKLSNWLMRKGHYVLANPSLGLVSYLDNGVTHQYFIDMVSEIDITDI
jgi:hypothetical protein